MSINFGKALLDLNGFSANTDSPDICAAVFSPVSLNLISALSSCIISGKWLNVTLGKHKCLELIKPKMKKDSFPINIFMKIPFYCFKDISSMVFDGDTLTFLPNILIFATTPPNPIN